ncbi:glycosyltransferase family 1 protein [Maridesulfovibrio zosterae]|uniref:glycosyltransferase family 1 protein n=1 Tax=Maridesulfovibrio zosterae TaxID=82171 RepID=UPI00040176B9|nr:glycosyltransferase family 1 protein [Maridesulfovibrio zosterae]
MNTYIFIPPVRKATGGITVFCQIASILARAGHSVQLVMRESGSWMPQIAEGYPEPIHWDDLRLTPDDLWLVPEGWVNSLTPGLNAGAKCVVYCQNWAYLFSSLPDGVLWRNLPVSFLAVSHPVEWFMQQTLSRGSPILRPGIDTDLFHAPEKKPSGPIRIGYMPRKNKALVSQIKSIYKARNPDTDIRWIEIAGMDAKGVAETLRACHIFLVSGFPEGCPLPPLEALASGCIPVGFSGFGGWDYMRQIDGAVFKPWWPLRDVAWSGNGFWSADADVLDAALNLEKAIELWKQGGVNLDRALEAGQQTVQSYSMEIQAETVLDIWNKF